MEHRTITLKQAAAEYNRLKTELDVLNSSFASLVVNKDDDKLAAQIKQMLDAKTQQAEAYAETVRLLKQSRMKKIAVVGAVIAGVFIVTALLFSGGGSNTSSDVSRTDEPDDGGGLTSWGES
jgi:hypothetical protein